VFSLCLAYAFSLARRAGVSRWIVAPACLASAFSLRNGAMAIVLWKDSLFAVVCFTFMILLTHLLLSVSLRNKWKYWGILGVLLGVIPLYRHDGLAIALTHDSDASNLFFGLSARRLLWLCSWRYVFYRRQKGIYIPVFKVQPLSTVWVQQLIYTMRTAVVITQDAPLSQKECTFLDQVRSLDDLWRPMSYVFPGQIYHPSYRMPVATSRINEYNSILLRLYSRYPGLFLHHFLRSTAYLYLPYQYKDDSPTGTVCLTIGPNELGLKMIPKFVPGWKFLSTIIGTHTARRLIWIFWMPAISRISNPPCVFYSRFPLERHSLARNYLPPIMFTLSHFASYGSEEIRFNLLPAFCFIRFLICLAFVRIRSTTTSDPHARP